MEEKQELQELLKRLDESNRQQAKYARWQCILSVAAAVCCLLLLLTVAKIVPDIKELSNEISGIAVKADTVLTNLEIVTEQLAGMDLGEMVRNVDELVVTSRAGVEETMSKLNSIDFAELNRAIGNLSDVVEPMAKFFNVFR